MSRKKVLISAFACEPGKGSEEGVGWNIVRLMARQHDVWVVTDASSRAAVEAYRQEYALPGLHFTYFGLPAPLSRLRTSDHGIQLYYYAWQLAVLSIFRRLHREVHFDLAHHVTYCKYWAPSRLWRLGIPVVWGPVGGGESAPAAFMRSYGATGMLYEWARDVGRRLGELDPFVRSTVRGSSVALATTPQTAARIRRMHPERLEILSGCALDMDEIGRLGALPPPPSGRFRLLSAGRLLHWKGYHLAIEAFARAGLPNAEYWIAGSGPEEAQLEEQARRLGVGGQVKFLGRIPRHELLESLGNCHAFVHPSLHDSGGWAILEAMAAGRPVLCLDLGGPGVFVTPETGSKVRADSPEDAVERLAQEMTRLAADPNALAAAGRAARARVEREFSTDALSRSLERMYRTAAA